MKKGTLTNSDYVREENRNLKNRMFFKHERNSGLYTKSLKQDLELRLIYDQYCKSILGMQPWYKKRYSGNFDKIDHRILEQQFSCDGTFLREENTNEKVAYRTNDQGPFFVFEFLILYLSGVKRLRDLKLFDDLVTVKNYLELNRRAFRSRKDYKVYFESVFQEIKHLTKIQNKS